ncbi:endocuticle structural glycoprotein SgAbd-9-like [Daktulosphaira vitifoliae]|uniref:endocuticle structural glycoprotein SgAbd-9-like n=1 Tax=Daktulosphaira vitifoliae TaxID=58002 RepID=UPI0021AA3B6E|nr:endocuticle structural glycoprotein SgAbd-9-like [Daktulosphaira vitifoliae]XP_050539624.1 endocuticle structural glycoprotein SgAbd-9-like [Daktulosphaira vitifoliae]
MALYPSNVQLLCIVLMSAIGCLTQTKPILIPLPIPSSTPLPIFNPYNPNFPPPFAPLPNPNSRPFVPIIHQTFDITPEGSYSFGYQSADGNQRQESGTLKYPTIPGFQPVISVKGSYSSLSPGGTIVEVKYIADENGFQPFGLGIHPSIIRAVAQQVEQAKREKSQIVSF